MVLSSLTLLGLSLGNDPVLLNRWNTIVAFVPGGGMLLIHTAPVGSSVLMIYDCVNTNFIVTHTPEGVAFVQTLESRPRRVLPPIFANRSVGPSGAPATTELIVSLWWVTGGASLVSAGLIWSAWRRRPTPDRCPACGYSRVGLAASSTCPECGQTQ